MTVESLRAALTAHRLSVEDGELAFDDPPPELLSRLEILHTALRAVLTGRKWYGTTAADGIRPKVLELDPAKPIPPRIMLVCVEGDSCWDRLAPDARIDRPELFAAGKEQPRKRNRRGPRPCRTQ